MRRARRGAWWDGPAGQVLPPILKDPSSVPRPTRLNERTSVWSLSTHDATQRNRWFYVFENYTASRNIVRQSEELTFSKFPTVAVD